MLNRFFQEKGVMDHDNLLQLCLPLQVIKLINDVPFKPFGFFC